MNASIKLIRVSNIPVFIHWTFWFLFLLVGIQGFLNHWHLVQISLSFLLIIVVFICIVLHEFGHALAARKYGVKTKDIILTPIGGLARLENLPKKPLHELVVAIAGPLVNVLIALIFSIALLLLGYNDWMDLTIRSPFVDIPHFIEFLIKLNLTLFLFNLIPALPMDGGRILRAFLSQFMGRYRATLVSARIGQALALIMIGVGWYSGLSFSLILIGCFIIFMAQSEYSHAKLERTLKNTMVKNIMEINPATVQLGSTKVEWPEVERSRDIVALNENGYPIGIFYADDIESIKKIMEFGVDPISLIENNWESISPNDSLEKVILLFQNKKYTVLPVVEDDQLTGILDVDHLNNFVRSVPKKVKK